MPFRVGLEGRAVDDREFGDEVVQILTRRTAEEVADEQPVPGEFRHQTNIQTMFRVGPAVKVLHEIILALHMGQHVGMETIERLGRHRLVVLPPDRILDRRGANDELVLGRTPRMGAGGHQEGAADAQLALAALEGGFDQPRLKIVVIDVPKPRDPLFLKRLRRVHPSIGHMLAPDAGSRSVLALMHMRPPRRTQTSPDTGR